METSIKTQLYELIYTNIYQISYTLYINAEDLGVYIIPILYYLFRFRCCEGDIELKELFLQETCQKMRK